MSREKTKQSPHGEMIERENEKLPDKPMKNGPGEHKTDLAHPYSKLTPDPLMPI